MMTLYLLSLSGESYLLSSRREGVILKVLRADKGAGCVCVCLPGHGCAWHGARHGAQGFGPLPLCFGSGNTQSMLPVGLLQAARPVGSLQRVPSVHAWGPDSAPCRQARPHGALPPAPWVPAVLLLLCVLLQLSDERAGSRCLCDETRQKVLVLRAPFRRQVFLFVCLGFVDRNGCIKNKC